MVDQSVCEEWRTIPGWEGLYSVSNLGRVRRDAEYKNTWPGRIIARCMSSNGYYRVGLWRSGHAQFNALVHRLVLAAFTHPCPKGYQVNHINGNKADNRPENLEYVTPKENAKHSREVLGNQQCGENSGMAVLTDADVLDMRSRYRKGVTTYKALGRMFGVSSSNVAAIVRRLTWTHI